MRKAETFTALNGLRFLAALAVVIFHYAPRVAAYGHVPGTTRNLINEGPGAVGFFFILSGFVLAHRHLSGGARAPTASAFYWARFARLYPAYLLAFLLFLPIAAHRYILNSPAPAGHHTFVLSAVLSCLMLQSWTPLAQAWNGPGWSLSVEAFMYFMFPLIGFRLVKLRRRNSIFVLLLSWLIPSGLAAAHVAHWITDAVWLRYITNNPLLWTPLFVMGICASRMVSDWKKVPAGRANMLSALSFVALILLALLWPHKWADVFVTGGIAPLLVAVIICFTRSSGGIAKTVAGPLLGRLGEASYVVYILQAPMWHYWQEITTSLRAGPTEANVVALWQFAAFVPLLVLTSLALQRWVETPARAWLQNWKNRKPGYVIRESEKAIETHVPLELVPQQLKPH
ncbi:MAG: acyltransferase [Candidatus Acidiferrales bacterium]|jgi:peptidoglycan/LPS O-acetylase OafA/YrhL